MSKSVHDRRSFMKFMIGTPLVVYPHYLSARQPAPRIGIEASTLFSSRNNQVRLSNNNIDLRNKTIIWSMSNVRIKGAKGGTNIITTASELLVFRDSYNCIFENINFISNSINDGRIDGGLVSSYHKKMKNIIFINCKFKCNESQVNAIKLVFENDNSFGESIHFYNCEIIGSGRMGAEFQNHVDDGKSRYHDIRWIGGKISNTGLVNDRCGQGISFTGLGSDCVVDTIFDNNGYASFENCGASNFLLQGSSRNLFRNCAPISLSNARKMHDGVIRNFNCLDKSTANILIGNQNNLRMHGNNLKTTGRINVIGVTNSRSNNDIYETDNLTGLMITENNVEGFSQNNIWGNLKLNNPKFDLSNRSLPIMFSGNNTINNRVRNLDVNSSHIIIKKSYQANGASNNIIIS